MTPHEIELAAALNSTGGFLGRRFIVSVAAMAHTVELTERQRYYLEMLAWTYRRQIAPHLVPDAKPPALPKKSKPEKPAKVSAKPQREPDLSEPAAMRDLFDNGGITDGRK